MSTDVPSAPPPQQTENATTQPICCIMIGMAGSGKTTLLQRLNAHLHSTGQPVYVMNLDPAVGKLPYGANIDIRDTVNYKEVMKQYNLGPNGAIVTSLNLFATRFDQVSAFLEKRAPELKYVLLDTPGQIEVFTWSASGTIVTESLASQYPTVVVYVIDTPRCTSPATFMSNMLYACSILYKTQLPFVLAFNKVDVEPHEFAIEWMTDYDAFQAALEEDESFMSNLVHSMSLTLEEFYKELKAVGVSAVTGEGMDEFFEAVQQAAVDYNTNYKPELMAKIAKRASAEKARQAQEFAKFEADVRDTRGQRVVIDHGRTPQSSNDLDSESDDPSTESEQDSDDDIAPSLREYMADRFE